MNTNFKVIGLTRLGIKPKSTAREADTLITHQSELFNYYVVLTFEYIRSVTKQQVFVAYLSQCFTDNTYVTVQLSIKQVYLFIYFYANTKGANR